MALPNMRQAAHNCVARAKNLLANGDEPSARHACLELRFAIKYITYDQLQTYQDELPYDVVKKWQPRELINKMRTVDPFADCSSTLSRGPEVTPGELAPDAEFKTVGEDHRFSMGWAHKKHNTLGNYLHAPTIDQLESGSAPKLETIIARATEILNECEQVLSSHMFNFNFGNFFWFNCGDCKTLTKRRVKDPTKKQEVTRRGCGAVYFAEFPEGQQVRLTPHKVRYICLAPCEAENWVWTHRVVEGAIFACEKCGKKTKVTYQLVDVDAYEVSHQKVSSSVPLSFD